MKIAFTKPSRATSESERRACVNGNVEFSLQTRAVAFNARRSSFAFTLAEVLITLGIIGVVAAMTIPTLMTKLHNKTLESQFKKAYSELGQIAYQVQAEFGGCGSGYDDIQSFIVTKFHSTSSVPVDNKYYNYNKIQIKKGLHKDCINYRAQDWTKQQTYVLKDGAVVTLCAHNDLTMLGVDINGQNTKPNAYGHDLFYFTLEPNTCKLIPQTSSARDCTDEEKASCIGGSDDYNGYIYDGVECSKNSTSISNGFSCARYAIQNKCPDDPSKTYWECLP